MRTTVNQRSHTSGPRLRLGRWPRRARPLRRSRERELVAATRALFDERGMQDAPIEEIARAAGIARGLIYRAFSSKEELFVLTVTDYLDELDDVLEAAIDAADEPRARARALHRGLRRASASATRRSSTARCRSCSARRRAARDDLRVGLAAARPGHGGLPGPRRRRAARGLGGGRFAVEDPDYVANVLWTQTLGAMHLARIRVGVRAVDPGAGLFPVEPDEVVASCVRRRWVALATASRASTTSPRSPPTRRATSTSTRGARPADGQEDRQPGRPDRLPPLLRRREGQRRART